VLKLFTTDTIRDNSLSNSEEQLLSKFYDGEAGLCEIPEAHLLLTRSQQARFYLKGLREISIAVNQISRPCYSYNKLSRDGAHIDLWDRIVARLGHEIGPEGDWSVHYNLGLQHKRCDCLRCSIYLH